MDMLKNISFNEQPIEFILNAPYLVLVDPIVLQNVKGYLDSINVSEQIEITRKLQEHSEFRVGVSEVKEFKSGMYQLAASDLQACDYNESSKSICEVDSAFIMVVGVDKLLAVSKVVTWEKFDAALRSPVGDDSIFIEFVNELGGPFFGVIATVDGTDFKGDGRYKLREGVPIKLS
jgi:hypothetical protein